MILTFFRKTFPANVPYRNLIFIPLFFTFYFTLKLFGSAGFILEHFSDRSISVATSDGIDISKRVEVFYKAILFVLLWILLFTKLTLVIRKFIHEEELKIFNGISLAGFCLLFFELIGADMSSSIHFIFALMIVCSSAFFNFGKAKNKSNGVDHNINAQKNYLPAFTWSILLTVSLYFILWQLLSFFRINNLISIPVFVSITGFLVYSFYKNHFDFKWMKVTQPFVFLPILSFLSLEVFLIFNQRNFNIPVLFIYFLGLAFIFLRIYFNSRNIRSEHSGSSALSYLFNNWMPWMLAGIGLISFYQPVVQPEIDWFESANHVLPLHQWFSFGKIPFLDSYSSHALSDFGFGLLYSVFNGPDPLGGFVYRFFLGVIVMLIIYLFIYKISNDGFLATWIAIAYPYTDFLIPSYYHFVPLAAYAFILLYEKQSVQRYLFFFCSVLLMPLWRVDLGLSTLIAGTGGFLFLLILVPSFKLNKKVFYKGLGLSLSLIALLFLIAFTLDGKQLLVSLKDAISYMASFQSYGIRDLAPEHNLKYFSLYFILPTVVILIILDCIYSIVRQNAESQNRVIYGLAIIFLGIFYLSNLQRGLVRHTLAEYWDTAFTSFGFFIVSSIVLVRFINKNSSMRFFIFFIFSTLIVSNYVFRTPNLRLNNYYHLLTEKLNSPFQLQDGKEKISRITENPAYQNQYKEFSEWMNKHIGQQSTFLDFSNTPMLYYFTNRKIPNYLVQIPHTAHNEYLQNRFLEDLKEYDIPIVVYSNVPQTFWDILDGIPNTLRHYRISEYIYRNYKPGMILNNRSIWVKKDATIPKENKIYSINGDSLLLQDIVKEDSSFTVIADKGIINYKFNQPIIFSGKKIYFMMELFSSNNGQIVFEYRSSSGNFNDKQKVTYNLFGGRNNVFAMLDTLKNEKDIGEFKITLPSNIVFKISSAGISSSNSFPDHVSNQPSDYNLKWIPFYWGEYDENHRSGNIGIEKIIFTGEKNIDANTVSHFEFTPVKNKEFGNYIRINASAPNAKPTDVLLTYGNENGKSGSFTFTMKNDTLFHDYLIRISSQFNWYNEANNWFQIYPINNSIKLKQAEILKGD
jgi:hypothetical protein